MSAASGSVWRCHHSGPGSFDETARRVGHAELAVAELLAKEGHHVRSLPEGRGPGRTADFLACGTLVEAKSFVTVAEREGRLPSAESVANKMLNARGQGAVAVIWAVGSGLSEAVARSGYLMFCQRAMSEGLGRLRSVRVVGEGFDVRFEPVADLRAGWQADKRARLARSSAQSRRLAHGRDLGAKPALKGLSRRPAARRQPMPRPKAPGL
jgi:hypothetical protein